jgi:hypothetical protein
MEQHVRILGVIYVVYGVFLLIIAGGLFALLTGIGLATQDHTAAWIMSGVGTFIAVIIAVLSIPTIVTGIGLQRFRPWARILGIVLAVFKMLAFPLGTAVAVYAFWVLLNEKTTPLFTPAHLRVT